MLRLFNIAPDAQGGTDDDGHVTVDTHFDLELTP